MVYQLLLRVLTTVTREETELYLVTSYLPTAICLEGCGDIFSVVKPVIVRADKRVHCKTGELLGEVKSLVRVVLWQ